MRRDPDIPRDIFPRTYSPDNSPFLRGVRHFPLPPPPSANLQYKAHYRVYKIDSAHGQENWLTSFLDNSRPVGRLGLGLGSGPHVVGRLGSGLRIMGRLGSRVWIHSFIHSFIHY